MFKIDSFEDEIHQSMEKTLLANQVEEKHGFNKLAKAVDYLNEAAEIFENAGMKAEALEVIDILNKFATNLKEKKK